MVNTYNGILLSLKGKEILTRPTTRMNLEGIVLSDISRVQKDKDFVILLM